MRISDWSSDVCSSDLGRQNRLAQIRYTIAKAMGLIDGTADYLFLWATGSGALEAKVGKNGQQPNQIDFEVWCTEMGVPYRTFTSVEEIGRASWRERVSQYV